MNNRKKWLAAAGVITAALWLMASGGIQSAYNLIENTGTPLTRRTTLNFTGPGVNCADASPLTTCTVSGGTGGGLTVFSGSSVTLLGTQYVAIGGGAAISSTEATVEIASPVAAQVSNLSVEISTALGLATSAVFTWRDGGTGESLTCTISGATATTCADNTHSFNVAQGDEIDIQVVTTGTPSAVTLVIGTQFGTLSDLNQTFTLANASSTGTTVNTPTKLTGAPSTGVSSATTDTANGVIVGICQSGCGTTGTAVIQTAGLIGCAFDSSGSTAGHFVQNSAAAAKSCADAGATFPTSGGEVLGRVLSTNAGAGTYIVAMLLQPAAGGGGGGGLTAAPPYYTDSTHFYVAATGYQATKPSATPTWINSVTPGTVTAGTNGDLVASGTGVYFATLSGTASVEAEFSMTGNFNSMSAGQSAHVWIYDSTNSAIWTFETTQNQLNPSALLVNQWSYSGSGNPSFVSGGTRFYEPICGSPACHLKINVSGSTASFQVSLNGGVVFTTLETQSVGTIAQAGYGFYSDGSHTAVMDVYSVVVH